VYLIIYITVSSDLDPNVGYVVKFRIFCTINTKPQINVGAYHKFNNYWIPHTYIRKWTDTHTHTHTHTHTCMHTYLIPANIAQWCLWFLCL